MNDRDVALALGGIAAIGAAAWVGVPAMIFLPFAAAFALWYVLR
jgi:hypothetical protein